MNVATTRVIARFDQNGDGKLSKHEAATSTGLQRFVQDGFVKADRLDAAVTRLSAAEQAELAAAAVRSQGAARAGIASMIVTGLALPAGVATRLANFSWGPVTLICVAGSALLLLAAKLLGANVDRFEAALAKLK